ncbi:unnamed protein product [Phytophthora fragariaefolia]|uniref:Unnamed protein product n=1 Tax=Phytophthora fragariaefolia TaxID=1490495 RepID=A0A9W6TSJ2_9STRA|nr:unnamed protein product [Phytophthora fragariaefolia]
MYFPTKHNKGFVSDVKINEAIKYKVRHESGYKGNMHKWLQTLNEFINEGEFDDFAAYHHDGDESSRTMLEQRRTVPLQHQTYVSSENSADRELWDEILRASSLPDYDDTFVETQEGEGTGNRHDSDTEKEPEGAENNILTEIYPENVEAKNESAEAVGETAAADADGQSDYSDQDNEDDHEVKVDEDYAQSIAHITT